MFIKWIKYIFNFNLKRKPYISSLSLNIIAVILFLAGFLNFNILIIILSIIIFIIGLKIDWHFSFLILIIPIILIIKHYTFHYLNNKYVDINVQVKDTNSFGLVINYHGTMILVNTNSKFNIGDNIHIYGKIIDVQNYANFDKKTYLLTKRITSEMKWPSIKLINHSNSINTKFFNFINDSNSKNYSNYTNLLLLGKKTENNKEIYNLLIELNILHLFVISGFHISLFFFILKKIFIKFKLSDEISSYISFLPILIYLFILNFPISSTRAFFYILLVIINKNFLRNRFSSIELLSFLAVIFLFYNPYIVYSFSYIFTFLASFLILLVNRSNWNKKYKLITLPLFVYLGTLPISMKLNNFISILGFFWGLIFAPIIAIFYVTSLFLFPFKNIMINIYFVLDKIIHFFEEINILIPITNINISIIITYYYFYWLIPLNCSIWLLPNFFYIPIFFSYLIL